METFTLRTHRRCEMLDITERIREIAAKSDIKEGMAVVFVPHTTAGVTINENADPSVTEDILMALEELIPPHRAEYRHTEGNSDAHIKASLVGSSVTVLIKNGSLNLGTWQGIYFCEFDGPRNRSVFVHIQ